MATKKIGRPTYRVTAQRSGKWWALEAPAVRGALSQVRRLDEAEPMIREAIALVLDVDEQSFDVELEIVVDGGMLDAELALAREMREAVAALRVRSDALSRRVARANAAEGIPVRDIATMLEVSFQFASRLAVALEEKCPRLVEPGTPSAKLVVELNEQLREDELLEQGVLGNSGEGADIIIPGPPGALRARRRGAHLVGH